MTDRKRTTAIQVRVTEQEKAKAGASGQTVRPISIRDLRRVGAGKPAAVFPRQRFHALYQQVNFLRITSPPKPVDQTAAQLDELAGQKS